MPQRKPMTQEWKSPRALLLCHGVGNYGPGDYDNLKTALKEAVGDKIWNSYAVYEVYYDEINDWIAEKNQAAAAVAKVLKLFGADSNSDDAANAAVEGAGDVLWPVFSLAARDALRRTFIQQLIQLVVDGEHKYGAEEQEVVILAHSLGCFHTYESLWALATDRQYGMTPATRDAPIYRNVVLVASPVQLIRGIAEKIPGVIPKPDGLATLRHPRLSVPAQEYGGRRYPAVRRMIALTGDMDPVGGYIVGKKVTWAYMDMPYEPEFESVVEHQQPLTVEPDSTLPSIFRELVNRNDPHISLENPHSWERYVTQNAKRVAEWLGA
jgi:hypothetical protein